MAYFQFKHSDNEHKHNIDQLLHAPFFKSEAENPERAAILIEKIHYTYADLSKFSRKISAHLHHKGLQKGDRVGLYLEKSFELYSAVLGTLSSGCVYVPMAPTYPADRLGMIAEQATPRLIFYDSRLGEKPNFFNTLICDINDIPDHEVEYSLPTVNGEDLAYILFTSGSTGKPKGVMVSHSNASNFVNWARGYCNARDTDVFSGHSDLNFDLSIFDTFVPWGVGACLAPVCNTMDKTTPSEFIKNNKITVWFSVPSVLSSMAAFSDLKPENLSGLRWALFCGEPLLAKPVQALMKAAAHLDVANLYGPTEATVACSAYKICNSLLDDEASIPIGWKTQGTEIFVWHKDGRVASDGEEGEIYIYGDQVAPGYWQNEKESRARFVVDPRHENSQYKCYKTGDLAVVGSAGPIFRGRADNQIKFRGWRIELADIEYALAKQDHIVECAVSLVVREGKTDALVGFIRCSASIANNKLIAALKKHLPNYMIPTHLRVVDNFPRTLNGKIDRKSLAELF